MMAFSMFFRNQNNIQFGAKSQLVSPLVENLSREKRKREGLMSSGSLWDLSIKSYYLRRLPPIKMKRRQSKKRRKRKRTMKRTTEDTE